MAPVEGSMDSLTRAVMDEARAEADQILAEARAKAEGIQKQAQAECDRQRNEILESAKQEAERNHRQAVAAAQIKARTMQLEKREVLLNRVFETARKQIPTVVQRSDYDKITRRLLKEGLARLGAGKAVIYADQATLQCLSQEMLNELSKELNLELHVKEPLKQGTGIIVESEDGRRRYDNTLETRLSRIQDTLRAPTYHILSGGSK